MNKVMEEKIRKILNDINEEIIMYEGSDLLEDKVIDSFEVMEIVAALEESFNIELDPDNIISENFANMQSIIEMMKKCLEA